ncbi:MAG TPA: alpha-2-macroglobulin [Azospirillum sp.]
MARVLVLLWLCLLLLLPAHPALANFDPPGLGNDAGNYASSVRLKAPPQVTPQQRDKALRDAQAAVAKRDWPKAVSGLEAAVALGNDTTATWLSLGEAWLALPKPNRERALHAAFTAYQSAGNADESVTALWRLMTLLDEVFDRPEAALQAAREIVTVAQPKDSGVALDVRAPGLDARIQALRQRVGLTVKSVRIDSDQAVPRACIRFSDQLSDKKGIRFADFVVLEPALPKAPVSARGDTLCVGGLSHGSAYAITLRQGLPGVDGLALKADEVQRLRVADRRPLVAFRGNAFILPRAGGEGIPLTTVNLQGVAVKVLRINDRNLTPNMRSGRLLEPLNPYGRDEIADGEGELVWQGRMDVGNERNREVTTALPFRTMVPDPKPGLYIVTADPVDVPEGDLPYERATQWVLVTDVGLTAFEGADGINVFARSYATAKPMPGVSVALVARNNAELARVTTDEQGRARFAPGLARGTGGNAPLAVMAYAGADYALLNMTNAAFDLSDRGVGGRPAPGPMDAFVYTERGVYRQGETVHIAALLRDDKTDAIEDFPLTVKVLRPSGTEYHAGPLNAGPAGGFTLPLALSRTAPLGGWTVQVFADPKGQPVGHASFQVEDFVPERLAVDLTPPAPFIEVGKPYDLLVKGRFLYGPPAAGLPGTAEVSLKADPAPYPQHKGFRFGLVTETVTPKMEELEFPVTDAQGETRLPVKLPALPDVTRPLRADIRVTVSEPGGRPTRAAVSLPVRSKAYAVGIRPRFEGPRLGEGQEAAFDVIAVAPDGAPIAKPDLAWELIEEHATFQWYLQGGRYTYRAHTRDIPRKAGTVDARADTPAALALGAQPFGRYRLEVMDKASGVASSVRFAVGWQMAENAADTPDTLEVVADKPAYRPGEAARVRITPPFAGEVLLTVATDRLFEVRTLSVPAGGATVELPVDAAWGPGAYVTATAYRPPVKGKERQPVRAVGVAWLGIDSAVRRLDVALEAPEVARPRGPVEVSVAVAPAVAGGNAEDAYVTLAAVDEGILRLTDYASPDPGRQFFGKRLLGLDIRDDYGRLIDALDGPFGKLREGGDGSGAAMPVVPFTVVSLFQGPLKVGADGRVRVRLDIPDFNGELRLMAVAFSKGRVGAASGKLTVRDPLVAEAVMPRFLAPGDDSRLTLALHNVEAAAGTYRVTVTGSDGVAVENGALSVDLPAGERRSIPLPLKGITAGVARVSLDVQGPGGLALSRGYGITVRPSRPVDTQFVTRQIAPGASARLSAADVAAYLPGTARLSSTFSSGPPFDVAGILRSLDRYPYGCTEQTISRALPLLVVRDVELALGGAAKPDDTLDGRLDNAIARTLDKQRYDGAFGLWSGRDEADAWITAYAMEFLARAKAKGRLVPDKPFADGLAWLRQHAIDGGRSKEALASRAYALHVLALSGVAVPGSTRYLHDAFIDAMPTPLSKGQLGAALARLGDKERAESAFTAAVAHLAREPWHVDYGSTVRDAAALVTLMTETGMMGKRLTALVDRLPASATAAKLTSTQEQAWIVLAADTLMRGAAPLDLTLSGGARPKGDPFNLLPSAAQLAEGVAVANAGTAAVWQAVSVSGIPAQPQPAAREGLRVKRNFFTRAGEPLNLDAIRQNDVFVVVLEGEANTKLYHQAAITHPLPAGWEIENPRLGASEAGELPWLTDLTYARAVEARDDRFVAAMDLTEEEPKFKLAFLVRAVTPGVYELPGAVVEDMYKPRFFARQAAGRITVHPVE